LLVSYSLARRGLTREESVEHLLRGTGKLVQNSWTSEVYVGAVLVAYHVFSSNGKFLFVGNFRGKYGSCYFLLLFGHYGTFVMI